MRFNSGEKANDDVLAQAYAELCDIFVMDALALLTAPKLLPMAWVSLLQWLALARFWPMS